MSNNSYEMVSLYDYLGRAAGKALGWAVAKRASEFKAHVESRYIENKVYKGRVNLYERRLLEAFFNDSSNRQIIEKDEQEYIIKKQQNKGYGKN